MSIEPMDNTDALIAEHLSKRLDAKRGNAKRAFRRHLAREDVLKPLNWSRVAAAACVAGLLMGAFALRQHWERQAAYRPTLPALVSYRPPPALRLEEVREIRLIDDAYEIVVTNRDGRAHLEAKSIDGETVFDGPIDTGEARESIPPEVRQRLRGINLPPATREADE
jgi:hypothetical protein